MVRNADSVYNTIDSTWSKVASSQALLDLGKSFGGTKILASQLNKASKEVLTKHLLWSHIVCQVLRSDPRSSFVYFNKLHTFLPHSCCCGEAFVEVDLKPGSAYKYMLGNMEGRGQAPSERVPVRRDNKVDESLTALAALRSLKHRSSKETKLEDDHQANSDLDSGLPSTPSESSWQFRGGAVHDIMGLLPGSWAGL
ncbi:hypothetical protein VTL71DRAFT_10778 [Oculimacula yallundae]|uniref:Uncharacterized protein n=1 Tax=Oculimacula yallundae TaxID=86028 RepID=A0ABR4CU83_9HELO